MNPSFYYHIVYQNINNHKIIILRDGSKFKIEDLKIVDLANFSDFFEKYFSKLHCFNNEQPYLICTGCGSLKALETHILEKEDAEYLNLKGLEIYLYEDQYLNFGPVIKNYLEGPPKTQESKKYYIKYGTSIRGFETNETTLTTLYSFELESIKDFIKTNRLTKVTVYCGDYNADKYLQEKYPMLKIIVKNICMNRFFQTLAKQNFVNFDANKIEYKFISLNNSYKAHRHLTVAYLFDRKSLISFDTTKAIHGDLANHLWFDVEQWKKHEPKIYNKIKNNLIKIEDVKKLKIDNVEVPDSNFNDSFEYAPQEYFFQTFCAVVNETKFSHPISSFSEKTLNAISRGRPFILVAPPYTLEYLRSYGFKTFNDFWDESYDLEKNHERRLIKIFKLIDYIDNLPMTSLKNIYRNMTKVLEHNFNRIKEISEKNEFN